MTYCINHSISFIFLRKSLLDLDRLPSVSWSFEDFSSPSSGRMPLCHSVVSISCFLYPLSHLFLRFSEPHHPALSEKVWEENYLNLKYLSMSVRIIHAWLICWVKNSSLRIFFFPNFEDFPELTIEKSILIWHPFMWLVFLSGNAWFNSLP